VLLSGGVFLPGAVGPALAGVVGGEVDAALGRVDGPEALAAGVVEAGDDVPAGEEAEAGGEVHGLAAVLEFLGDRLNLLEVAGGRGRWAAVACSATASMAERSQLAASGEASSRAASSAGRASGPCRLSSRHAAAASAEPAPFGPTALTLVRSGVSSAAGAR